MKANLRNDLIAIILVEAFQYNEDYVEHWLTGKFDRAHPEPTRDDQDCMGMADRIVSRFEARCSRIEG